MCETVCVISSGASLEEVEDLRAGCGIDKPLSTNCPLEQRE
jgi:hypothetical protein